MDKNYVEIHVGWTILLHCKWKNEWWQLEMNHFCFQCHKHVEFYMRLWLGSGSLGIWTWHTWDPREIPSLSVSLLYPTFVWKSTGDCVWWMERWILRKTYICVILAKQKHYFLWFEYSNNMPQHSNSPHPSFSDEKRCKASSLLPPSLRKVKTHCWKS
jgi:hypothetical protein